MSRTSRTLKRLGVAGLATATIGAGIPVFFAGAASAAHVTSVSITPENQTASAGVCTFFDVAVTPAQVTVVDVQADANGGDVIFCTVDNNGALVQQQDADNIPNSADNGETREFTTLADGTVKVGVTFLNPNGTGVISLTAFVEEDGTASDNNLPNAGEPQDTATLTVAAGGPDAVETVNAEPEQALNQEGDTHVIDVTLTNANGTPVQGVTPVFDVTSGPDAPTVAPNTPCDGASDQNGKTTCTFTNVNGPGTDTIVVYVNQTNADNNTATADTNNVDAGEPSDTVTKTFVADQPAGSTVTLTCAENRTTAAGDACQNPTSDNTEVFTATVKNASGAPISGALVEFAITAGQNTDSDPTTAGDKESLSPTQCTTGADGTCSTTLTDTKPTNGEVITITATLGVVGGDQTDTATKTFQDPVARDARNIVLTPETATKTVGDVQSLTATVTDRFGNPVSGVQVTFTEDGTGRFTNGGTTTSGLTNAAGKVTVELTTNSGETPGSNTVTATITGFDTNGDGSIGATEGRNTGTGTTADDECEQASGKQSAGANTAPVNQTGETTAGNCSDTSSVNFVAAASPTPTATATATTTTTATATSTQTPPGCTTARQNLPVRFLAPSARINRNGQTGPTVNATALVTVSVTGAAPNSTVELEAYQQNHFGTANFANAGNTRTAVANADGVALFQVRFSSNARARAKQQGCAFGANAGFNQGSVGANSNVLYVRTVITFTVTRVGTRTVSIQGDSIPARPGGLIVNIHCTDARCSSATNPNGILFQVRANQVNGEFGPVRYTFAPAFQNNRVNLYAATGRQDTGEGDAQNVAGRSNNRNLLVF